MTGQDKPETRRIPARKRATVAASARAALLTRLEKQPVIQAERWTRDELYEDEFFEDERVP